MAVEGGLLSFYDCGQNFFSLILLPLWLWRDAFHLEGCRDFLFLQIACVSSVWCKQHQHQKYEMIIITIRIIAAVVMILFLLVRDYRFTELLSDL